jgi:hypothetical protein
MALGRGAAIESDAPGTVRVGFEAAMVPHISAETARPTTCRPGKGPENANAVPVFGRLRAVVALPGRLSLEGAVVPPLTLAGIDPRLFSVGLGYTRPLSASLAVSGRVHTTLGHLTGPITCSDRDLKDAASECFQGTLSNDRYSPNIAGADLAVGSAPSARRLSWYAGAGYTQLTPRFQVHFINRAGVLDTTRVEVDLNRVALFAGASWIVAKQLRASGEVYATPDDGATIRLMFDTLLRRGR